MKHHAFREHFPESRPDQTHAARCDHASQCHSHAIQETVTAYYAFHLLNHQLQRGVGQQWQTHPHLTAVPGWWQHRGGLCTPVAPSLVPAQLTLIGTHISSSAWGAKGSDTHPAPLSRAGTGELCPQHFLQPPLLLQSRITTAIEVHRGYPALPSDIWKERVHCCYREV